MGNVKIPRTLKDNDQILYSIKSEIDVYKGKHLEKVSTTNTLIGQRFNLNSIKYIN